MKRILLSVFAVAITAAWAVPASAADVSLSGQYRLRGEYRDNVDFNEDAGDDRASWAQRVRITANAKATDDTSVKATIQDTRTWGATGVLSDASTSTSVTNTVDLHEAYVNISNLLEQPVTLRAGRQELAYGDERIIGAFNWSNNGRAFDAFKLMYSTDAINVDVFAATVSEDSADTDATLNDDTDLNGVYATLKQVIPNNTLDVYLLHQTDNVDLTRYTVGARLKGAAAGVDYTVELPFQTGEQNATTDISAWALAVKAGYTLPTALKLRVGAEYDMGSGDDDATDNENGTWVDLFPTNHAHFGYADVSGANSWANLTAISVNATLDLNEKTKLYAAYWNYTQNETAAGADDSVGSEIDVTATYKYNNAVAVEAGISRFFVGDALATDGDDQDWAYLMLTANF
ncbi:MAG: alginate export family protein [Deltaproteobacteria bacterium]|nr:alginate export family protein [Deltaproteobacteria bacterium]